MRIPHPNLIVNCAIERLITLPAFNVALANGATPSVIASDPVKRVMNFVRDADLALVPLYTEFNSLTIAQVLGGINRVLDYTSTQFSVTPTGATALHDYFTPNARIARGGIVVGKIMSPFATSPHRWAQYKAVIEGAIGGGRSDSLIMWIQHIAYTLIDGRYIKYEPEFVEYVIEAEEHTFTDNYDETVSPNDIAANSKIPQDVLRWHFNVPFSSNNLINHGDIKALLESYKMPEQKVGITLAEMNYRIEHLMLVTASINVNAYLEPGWLRIPQYKVWFLDGNPNVRSLPSIFHVQFDTFRFDTVQAVSHFGDFKNSVIIGWDTSVSMEGIYPERSASFQMVVNDNLKLSFELKSKGDGISDRSGRMFQRPIPIRYRLSSMAWYKQYIIDGQNIRLPEDMTADELHRGLLKFNILSSQGRQFTNLFHIQEEIPLLNLPYMEDKEVLDFDNGNAYPAILSATVTAGPNHAQRLNFHMPLVIPKLEGFKINVPDLGQWHVGSNELHLFIQSSSQARIRNSRYWYGINPDDLEKIVNYYINTYLILSALELYRGDTYLDPHFGGTPQVLTARMNRQEWIRRQTEWNIVEYIKALSIAKSITDKTEISPTVFGG